MDQKWQGIFISVPWQPLIRWCIWCDSDDDDDKYDYDGSYQFAKCFYSLSRLQFDILSRSALICH